jgi:hypothetical protein
MKAILGNDFMSFGEGDITYEKTFDLYIFCAMLKAEAPL